MGQATVACQLCTTKSRQAVPLGGVHCASFLQCRPDCGRACLPDVMLFSLRSSCPALARPALPGRMCSGALGPAAAVLSRTCISPSFAGHACLQACSCCSNAALDSSRITPCSCRAKLQGRSFTGNLSGWPELGQSLFISASSINMSTRKSRPPGCTRIQDGNKEGCCSSGHPCKTAHQAPALQIHNAGAGVPPAAV